MEEHCLDAEAGSLLPFILISPKPLASFLVCPHKSQHVTSQNWYSWACYFRVSADPVFGVVWKVSSGFVTWFVGSVSPAGREPWAHMFGWLSFCIQITWISAWQCFTATEHSWRCLFSSFCSPFLNSRISSCNNTWRTLGSCKTQMLSSVINFSCRRIWVLLLAACKSLLLSDSLAQQAVTVCWWLLLITLGVIRTNLIVLLDPLGCCHGLVLIICKWIACFEGRHLRIRYCAVFQWAISFCISR